VVILTATLTEYKAVREHLDLDSLERIYHDERAHEKMQFHDKQKSWDIILILTGQGSLNAQSETLFALNKYKPEIMLFLGTAGGIKPQDVDLGDVVVANKIYCYEHGTWTEVTDTKTGKKELTFSARPELYYPDKKLTNRAELLLLDHTWKKRIKETKNETGRLARERAKVLCGPLATGSAILETMDAPPSKIVKANYEDSLAVEMEGFGFFHAVEEDRNVHATEIRGISDIVQDENKQTTDGAEWPETAMAHASAFAFGLIVIFSET
jgi:nucleoside phosphorylase